MSFLAFWYSHSLFDTSLKCSWIKPAGFDRDLLLYRSWAHLWQSQHLAPLQIHYLVQIFDLFKVWCILILLLMLSLLSPWLFARNEAAPTAHTHWSSIHLPHCRPFPFAPLAFPQYYHFAGIFHFQSPHRLPHCPIGDGCASSVEVLSWRYSSGLRSHAYWICWACCAWSTSWSWTCLFPSCFSRPDWWWISLSGGRSYLECSLPRSTMVAD